MVVTQTVSLRRLAEHELLRYRRRKLRVWLRIKPQTNSLRYIKM